MRTLKEGAVSKFNRIIAPFCKWVQNECDVYSFYRGELYCNSVGNICVEFVASDYDGNFKKPSLEFDPETGAIYYDRRSNFNFKDENIIKKVILKTVEKVEGMNPPISKLYFDFNNISSIRKAYVCDDPKEKGSIQLFLDTEDGSREKYNYSDGIKVLGVWLSGDWAELVSDLESAKVG